MKGTAEIQHYVYIRDGKQALNIKITTLNSSYLGFIPVINTRITNNFMSIC
jgi:hypothetical protein